MKGDKAPTRLTGFTALGGLDWTNDLLVLARHMLMEDEAKPSNLDQSSSSEQNERNATDQTETGHNSADTQTTSSTHFNSGGDVGFANPEDSQIWTPESLTKLGSIITSINALPAVWVIKDTAAANQAASSHSANAVNGMVGDLFQSPAIQPSMHHAHTSTVAVVDHPKADERDQNFVEPAPDPPGRQLTSTVLGEPSNNNNNDVGNGTDQAEATRPNQTSAVPLSYHSVQSGPVSDTSFLQGQPQAQTLAVPPTTAETAATNWPGGEPGLAEGPSASVALPALTGHAGPLGAPSSPDASVVAASGTFVPPSPDNHPAVIVAQPVQTTPGSAALTIPDPTNEPAVVDALASSGDSLSVALTTIVAPASDNHPAIIGIQSIPAEIPSAVSATEVSQDPAKALSVVSASASEQASQGSTIATPAEPPTSAAFNGSGIQDVSATPSATLPATSSDPHSTTTTPAVIVDCGDSQIPQLSSLQNDGPAVTVDGGAINTTAPLQITPAVVSGQETALETVKDVPYATHTAEHPALERSVSPDGPSNAVHTQAANDVPSDLMTAGSHPALHHATAARSGLIAPSVSCEEGGHPVTSVGSMATSEIADKPAAAGPTHSTSLQFDLASALSSLPERFTFQMGSPLPNSETPFTKIDNSGPSSAGMVAGDLIYETPHTVHYGSPGLGIPPHVAQVLLKLLPSVVQADISQSTGPYEHGAPGPIAGFDGGPSNSISEAHGSHNNIDRAEDTPSNSGSAGIHSYQGILGSHGNNDTHFSDNVFHFFGHHD